MRALNSAGDENRGGSDRRRRQHKRDRSDHRFIRIPAAGYGAVHHSSHAMTAILARSRILRGFRVMVLGYVAIPAGAAGHLVARPSRRCKWTIDNNHRQQTREGGESAVAVLKLTVHDQEFPAYKL